ncbi:hypothetical protein [Spirosoma koreense]
MAILTFIPLASGATEKRLTSTEGLDNGPDNSFYGNYVYFNSYRIGHRQICRM